jgi:hypothetical protein
VYTLAVAMTPTASVGTYPGDVMLNTSAGELLLTEPRLFDICC